MSKCKECGKAVSTLAKTCPNCGVPKPTLKKKTLAKKISKKTKKSTARDVSWSHCSNKECRDYSAMYRIPNSALSKRVCIRCKEPLKKAKIESDRPVMPTDGTYLNEEHFLKNQEKSDKVYKEVQAKKDDGKEPPILFIAVFVVVAWIIIFSVINSIDKADPIDKAKGFFDDRGAKKERCAERAENASNSYAAKKIYKACMSNN